MSVAFSFIDYLLFISVFISFRSNHLHNYSSVTRNIFAKSTGAKKIVIAGLSHNSDFFSSNSEK